MTTTQNEEGTVNTPDSVERLFELYESKGAEPYGEALTQVEHALQCAALATAERASDPMILAALFHDVGHLVVDVQNSEGFILDEDDDDHEAVGAQVLSPLFGPAVARPVSLHVTAKRWRCTREPTYIDQLSGASRATLTAQGGLLSDGECLRFEEHPGFVDALALRTWDDEAKVLGKKAGSLGDYEALANSLAASWSRARRAR
ncbi:MAG TPA: HD domain-containing protein [Acidimicrobiales bacterium]|jgi:predicted HD phosphohydrolase|nr:HD domain-containing protein [Acidimicrobiales bacterium]